MTVNRKIGSPMLLLLAGIFLALGLTGFAQAPDATGKGPLAVTRGDYKFPAVVDPQITPATTEIWARMYRPKTLSGGPYPLVVFLHGNHGTCGTGASPRSDSNCQYTSTGTCPANFVVTPNHLGYAYMAERLASWGYIVVSINANRGITCGGGPPGDSFLIHARGRLVLRHLQRLSEWNTFGGAPASLGLGPNGLIGKIDFSNVGLMGHSRGGEGIRAAYYFYNNDPYWGGVIPDYVNMAGLFEIGPVDGQSAIPLNAQDTTWNVVLPMCDGDVSNLQGIKPFDRMITGNFEFVPTQKSSYSAWGTNHNFYNTEWQQSDANPAGCTGPGHIALFPNANGSVAQRRVGRASLLAFFRGNLASPVPGAYNPAFNKNFNPQNALTVPASRVDRGFTNSPDSSVNTVFEDFDQPTGTNTYGSANNAAGIVINHGGGIIANHDPAQRAGAISWAVPGGFFQTNWADAGTGYDVTSYLTLDLRVSRQPVAPNPGAPATNFSIQLMDANGTLSAAAQLNAYTNLTGPISGPGGVHPILQTARIPLTAFTGVDQTQIQGVRFTFNGSPNGAIYLANIRLSTVNGPLPTDGPDSLADGVLEDRPADDPIDPVVMDSMNIINRIRTVGSAAQLLNQPGVEIEVVSDRVFPVRGEKVALRIGTNEYLLSRYPEDGDTHTLLFTLTPEQFAQAKNGEPLVVQYGDGQQSGDRWNFGSLDKTLLDK